MTDRTATPDERQERLAELCGDLFAKRPLIVASNRGPLEYHLTPDGRLQARRGSGAVVTALNLLLRGSEFTWVANAMGEGDRRALETAEGGAIRSPLPNQQISMRYVTTPRRVYHKFYNIFCNPLLWFLQHSMWSAPYTPNIDATVQDAWSNGYEPVNRAFSDAIVAEAARNSQPPLVILHDYHLYLTPGMVRREIGDALLYHYIHIPWPSLRSWQLLPASIRGPIYESLCACDLMGFQSWSDAHNFLACCEGFVPGARVDYATGVVTVDGHETTVRAYPTSIDVEEVRQIAAAPRTQDFHRRVEPLCAPHTIVRVDRTEPSKNITRGFRAYEILLERHPDLRGRVTFLAFLVPSRTHIKQYERYQDEISNLVRSINGTYGSADWQPVQVFSENNYAQAMAGLQLYDSLLVNPVVDGMNLVTKEGPIVNGKNGVLVLSETSGAYDQLGEGSIAVAPADLDGTADALYQAIMMSPEERERRSRTLVDAIEREDVTQWLLSQMEQLASLASRAPG